MALRFRWPCALVATALACLTGQSSLAQPPAAAATAKPATAATSAVRLTKAVLFNSGVGFFERSGKVAGDQELELQFNAEDINDLRETKEQIEQTRIQMDQAERKSDYEAAARLRYGQLRDLEPSWRNRKAS